MSKLNDIITSRGFWDEVEVLEAKKQIKDLFLEIAIKLEDSNAEGFLMIPASEFKDEVNKL